jgi:hypothetical protein
MCGQGIAVALALAVLCALCAGCSGNPPPAILPAAGIVRIDGKPLNKAAVRFVPVGDVAPEYIASGVTDEAGRFTLTCKGQPGACAGENRVLVMEADLPANLQSEKAQLELAKYFRSLGGRPIPPRYTNLVDTPLTATVSEGRGDHALDLTR